MKSSPVEAQNEKNIYDVGLSRSVLSTVSRDIGWRDRFTVKSDIETPPKNHVKSRR